MNYPLPFWSTFTPNQPFSDYTNYWNRYSQEERIKRICEDLWKLIQIYKMLVDAINDHETRIEVLEAKVKELEEKITDLYNKYNDIVNKINSLDQRVTNDENQINSLNQRFTALEQQMTNLINNLPTQIKNIVNEILDSAEFLQKLTTLVNQIIASLLENKMDKVPTATVDNFATYGTGGQVKDSGKKSSDFVSAVTGATTDDIAFFGTNGQLKDSGKVISTNPCTYDSDDTKVPTAKAVYRSIIEFLTDTNMDNIPLRFGNYYLDNTSVSWNITVGGLVYYTNCIHVEAPNNSQNVRVQSGWFKNPTNPTPVLMERYYNITGASWSSWQIVSHEYIQSTEALAQSVSTANPNALVYVPEV